MEWLNILYRTEEDKLVTDSQEIIRLHIPVGAVGERVVDDLSKEIWSESEGCRGDDEKHKAQSH